MKLSKIIFGTDLPQEYLCLAMEEFSQPLKVMLCSDRNKSSIDVTDEHVFLGYKPVMIAIPSERLENDPASDKIKLEFSFNDEIIASLALKPFRKKESGDSSLFIFEGEKGGHEFLSAFHRLTNKLRYELKAKRKGNVFLPGNNYEQVHIAYSVPRKISIITLGNGAHFNMFPTDLHGGIGNEYYVISLRHGGKASKQVEELKAIVLSSVQADRFNETYSLGKNHMQDLKTPDNFKFQNKRSEKFKLPLPDMAIDHRELEWVDSFICGIHKLHFFRIIHRSAKENAAPSLGHIHKFYAQWRKDNKLPANYLIR